MKTIYTVILITLLIGNKVNAQNVNIPDANFKAALVADTAIDLNADSIIQVSEATAFTGTITVTNMGITDLTGIEAFIHLKRLDCNTNLLTSLNISTNTDLKYLNCTGNQLTNLDVSNNIALTDLLCPANQIASLDVSNNVHLVRLFCHLNQLANLSVATNLSLTNLLCSTNQLTSLNVSANITLTTLICSHNQLTSLDVSADTNLLVLGCGNNLLTTLNVKNNHNTHFTSFTATSNPNLTCIEVDNVAYSNTNWSTGIDAGAHFSTNCSGTTSIAENAEATTITLYPNPAKESFQIIDNAVNSQQSTVKIVNLLGEVVLQSPITNQQSLIDVSNWNKGIYFVQVTDENKNINVTHKIVVQ